MDKQLHDRLTDDGLEVIQFETSRQMKAILQAQAEMLNISVSEYLDRLIHSWMELVAKTAGYTETENKN